jgi:hypothetical protein
LWVSVVWLDQRAMLIQFTVSSAGMRSNSPGCLSPAQALHFVHELRYAGR